MNENKGPCGVCKGAYDEHFNSEGKPKTQHAYVAEGGSLMTQKEAAEARGPQKPAMMNPGLAYMGNAGMSVARLTELLLEKNLLSPEEGLYIAGFGPKPVLETPKFRDPSSFGVDSPGGGI